jgi:integrase
MAVIQQRTTSQGEVHYRVLVRIKGFPAQSATFKRRTDAKLWAIRTESDIREGRHFPARNRQRNTLGDLLDRYLAEVIDRRPAGAWRPLNVLAFWRRELGDCSLLEVTPARIAACRDKLMSESSRRGTPRSANTAIRYLAVLSHAYSVAVREWGWVEASPVARVSRPKAPRGRVRFLSQQEKTRLLAACENGQAPLLLPVVLLAISTGARRGEILGLRWPQVSLERRVIVLEETKNGERRALPLAGAALDVMIKLAQERRCDTDLVFARADGRGPFQLWPAWNRAVKEAELEDFRFHDLRHTAASYLAMSGATLAEIAAVLGHKTLAMVKRYAHLSEQHTSDVVARMNAKFL